MTLPAVNGAGRDFAIVCGGGTKRKREHLAFGFKLPFAATPIRRKP
jgi:hypothetical protein